jgi:FMN phosphatase YigB (HAD superfamily)
VQTPQTRLADAGWRRIAAGGALKRVLHSLRSLDQATRLIDAAEIVAFDFDALIMRRAASNDAVLGYVGFLLRQRDERLTGFVDRRKQAERMARMTLGQEKDLDRGLIYACFAADDVWSSTVIAQACALEREMELGTLAPRLDVVALVEYASHRMKRKILVSNTRIPRSCVMNALKIWNLLQHFDYVYLSAERPPQADPAGFCAVVAAKEAVTPAAILLIADDWRLAGDMAWSRECGCAVITSVDWRGLVFADSESSRDWRSELILTPFAKRIADRAYGAQQSQMISIAAEHELGYVVVGPLLLGFMAWLFNVAALSHSKRLLFASHQGYFLRDAYNRLRLRLRQTHLPEGEYVYVSPRLVLAASQAIDFDTTRILAGASDRMTVAELLDTRIGFRSPSSVPLATEVSLPEDSAYVEHILRMLEPEIVEQAEPNHAGFMAYWRSLDLDDDEVVGLVDLEASAVTQKALQKLVGRPLLGLYLARGRPGENGEIAEGLAISCFQDDSGLRSSSQPRLGSTERGLLDALFTAPHGAVSHFSLNAAGYPAPIFLDSEIAQKHFPRLQTIFSGAEAYCEDALSSYGDALFPALAHGQSAGLAPLRMLAKGQIGLDGKLAALLRGGDAVERRGSTCLTPSHHNLNNPRPEIRMPNRKPVRLKVLDDLPPVYHSYALFGVENTQIPGIYARNQLSKQPIILAYIQFAIAKCKKTISDQVSFAELFCADGFFAMSAIHLGATTSYGVDNDRDDQSGVMTEIAERLGLDVNLKKMDVADIDQLEQVDIVANVGGLYHVSNPDEILEKSYRLARRFLVVQTVVSIANSDADYFETPAPGWTWGSRYSRNSFERHLASKNWKIIDTHFNLLEGNTREEDLGSCYALVEKA